MKIGDKVKIYESGRIGVIIGETATSWKIDFEGGDKPELVAKTVPMELYENGGGNGGYQGDGSKPKKRMNWKGWAWTIGIILFIAAALFITFKSVL